MEVRIIMNLKFVDDYIQKKLSENENYIRYTFYELRVKNNLSEDEVDKFLELNKNYLEKKGYKVFFTGAKFTYENANRTVQPNELMIAIKEKNER
jgi:beta-N-acetylglucosaminidase